MESGLRSRSTDRCFSQWESQTWVTGQRPAKLFTSFFLPLRQSSLNNHDHRPRKIVGAEWIGRVVHDRPGNLDSLLPPFHLLQRLVHGFTIPFVRYLRQRYCSKALSSASLSRRRVRPTTNKIINPTTDVMIPIIWASPDSTCGDEPKCRP